MTSSHSHNTSSTPHNTRARAGASSDQHASARASSSSSASRSGVGKDDDARSTSAVGGDKLAQDSATVGRQDANQSVSGDSRAEPCMNSGSIIEDSDKGISHSSQQPSSQQHQPSQNEPTPHDDQSAFPSSSVHREVTEPPSHGDSDSGDSETEEQNQDQADPSSSLSASFLSQLKNESRTPTARYSFDDHQDYFHRLEWEALVVGHQRQHAHPHPTSSSNPLPNMVSSSPKSEENPSPSSSSSRSASPASAQTAIGGESSSPRPKLAPLDAARGPPRPVAVRKRSNSADGGVVYGSFRNGRYTARPRHAHPGPPSPSHILLNMRSPQPWEQRLQNRPGSAQGRPRSNSHADDPSSAWARRAGLSQFADAGIPGTSFPHPSVYGGAVGVASQAGPRDEDGSGENTVQPWDSPRMPRRSLTVAGEQGGVKKAKRSSQDMANVALQPVPASDGLGRALTSQSIDVADLSSSAPQVQRQLTRASTTGPAVGDAAQPSSHGDEPDSHRDDDDDDDDDNESSKEPKPTFSQRTKSAIKSIRLSSNYFALYKVCDRTDIALLCIGIIAAIGSGVPLPLIGILFGQLIDGFNSASCDTSSAPSNTSAFLSSVNDKVSKIAIIAAVNFFLIWTYTTCWSNLGERIVRKLRKRYLSSVLRQDMAFFDMLKPGEVGTRLSADLLTVQNGTSEKMGILISSLSYFGTSYIVAFIKLPKLAGQLVSLLPAFGVVSIIGSRFVAKAQKNTSTHLSHAASLAAEALNNLPVVQAFGSQPRLSNIYQSHLERARKQGTMKALAAACVLGMLFFVGYSANALAFFSGSNLIASSGNPSTVGSVYTVIFLLLDASFIVGQIAPYLQTFSAASGAGQALRETINKPSPIDGTDANTGITPQPGDVADIAVELEDVHFSYPARPDEKALDGLSISVPAGHRVALVGLSGSGKSTVASLLQRFYDPSSGRVTLNGTDLRAYNMRWLRSQIGVVGQEPVLFDCSIMQSIAHGLLGSPAHAHLHSTLLAYSQVGQEKTGTELSDILTTPSQLEELEEIKALCVKAAKLAGAHGFIEKLPEGYETQVGEAGGKLSGGQKQRISIARAVVKQPKLLILDEATAALDSQSERKVGEALDSISEGVTTVAIAHRLATIRGYDQIVVMGKGKGLEKGTHKELLAQRGYYYKLAAAQDTGSNPQGETKDGGEDREEEDKHAKEADTGAKQSRGQRRMDDVAEGDEDSGEGEDSAGRDSGASTLLRNSSEDTRNDKTRGNDQDNDREARDSNDEKQATDAQLESLAGKYPARIVFARIAWLLRREWPYILVGLFTSTIMGGSYSGEAVLFGHVIEALNPVCRGPDNVRSAGREFGLYFFILALIQLFAYSINGLVWGLVAERLLFRLRRVSFDTMMDQRLTWYEAQDQNPASMIASLSNDANNLGGVTGTVIGTIFCILVNLLAGIIVSHAIAWRIAIVILALVPIILTAGYLRLKVLADFQKRHETAYVKSNSLAIEAVQCIKTVAALGREADVLGKLEKSLERPYRESRRHYAYGNVFLALALSVSYFIYAFAYWWGSQNIAQGRYGQTAFFIVLPALLFSAQASGQLLAFAPDFSKAHVSAANFFRLIDQRPAVVDRKRQEAGEEKRGDVEEEGAADAAVEKKTPSTVEFKEVSFTYPTRSEPALRDVSLKIPGGCFAAFVGESGSGKTTAMSLIENFYTPSSGTVSVDGLRTDRTPDQILRRDIAIVPQEPVIFYGTVRFNVLLGLRPDIQPSPTTPVRRRKNRRRRRHARREDDSALLAPYKEDASWQTSIPDSVIEDACRAAGIHETILGFKKGYDTLITSSQLSGGQKQRLSIARALIRKPRLLLLDESTSALDSQSEQAFQKTLSEIREKGECTILAIAHRMRTIKDADLIFLFENGEVEAQGSYQALMRESDKFKAMVSYQSLN